MGYNACGEIRKLRKVLVDFGLKAKIIIGSTREILNVIEWLNAVAHIVTVAPKLLEGMIVHPYSKETVQQFLQDAERAKELAVEEKSVRLDTIDSRKAITNLEAVNESTK
jgi:transaldolase